jgi:hypothetical protein
VLSLDAPAVSLLWQALLARVGGVALGWPPMAVLGLSVWLAYAADRWIEGWRLDHAQVRTPRHYFYQRYRWPVAVVWVVACLADVWVAFAYLPRFDLLAGFSLLAAVAAYLLSHQLVHRHHRWRLPKEICIAGLLSAGVAVFLLRAPSWTELVMPLTLFALLCFANCALISVWEQHVDRAHGQTSLAIDSADNARAIVQLPFLIVVLAGVAAAAGAGAGRMAAVCAGASAMLLASVDWAEPRIGRQLARVLADVSLMTPAVALLWA